MDTVTTPAAAAASAVPLPVVSIPILAALGMDAGTLGWALAGVVIVQTLLPRKAAGLWATTVLAFASMLFASVAAPFLAAGIGGLGWQWLHNVPADNIKSAAAALAGGFAQPLLLWVRSLIPQRGASVADAARRWRRDAPATQPPQQQQQQEQQP